MENDNRSHVLVARDLDYPADGRRVLIGGSNRYCLEYLEQARQGGSWLDPYLTQPRRWVVRVETVGNCKK